MADNLEVAAMLMAVRMDEITRESLARRNPAEIRVKILQEYQVCLAALTELNKPSASTEQPNPVRQEKRK